MKEKQINVLYACELEDNYKPTLCAFEGKATKEQIRKALLTYDETLDDDEEEFENIVDHVYNDGEFEYQEVHFFFDTTTLYCE